MACETGDPLAGLKAFFDFLGDPIGGIVKGIGNLILAAAIQVFGDLTVNIPTLSTDGASQDISLQTRWVVVYTAVASLLFASIRMALERRGEAGQTALKGLLRVILVAGGATAVATALADLSDRYADHLFTAAAQEQLLSIGCGESRIEGFLLIVLALLLLLAGIIHTVLLYIRLGVMILLLGTLPVAAAASMTAWGDTWWRKHVGWMIAWLLYKPAAGLVLFAGSAMIGSGSDGGIQEKIAGIGVMLLSAIALPALLKLVVPATAALGSGGPQGGTLAAAGVLASGAKSVGGSIGSPSGGSGGAGSAGPTGAGGSAGAAGSSRAAAAGAAGGPLGVAAGVAAQTLGQAVKGATQAAAGAVEGADGELAMPRDSHR